MTIPKEEFFLDKLYKLQNLIFLLENTNDDGFLEKILGINRFNHLVLIVDDFKKRLIKMKYDHRIFYGYEI